MSTTNRRSATPTTQSDNALLVRHFFDAMGPTLDAFKQNYRDRLAEDVVWESVGHPPRVGRAASLAYLDELNRRTGMEYCTIEVLHLADAGDVVLSERIDTMHRADGTPIMSFPIMGAVQIRDGLIVRYTDYFDTSATTSQHVGERIASPRSYAEVTPPADPPGTRAWVDWANGLPATRAVGLRCLSVGAGEVSMRVDESVWPTNPNGALHGGLVFAAIDQCMGVAAMSAQDAGSFTSTVSLNIDFIAPAMPPLSLDAMVTRSGRTMAFVELSTADAGGRTCARASGVWAIHPTAPTLTDGTS
jgi:limonene-1,2-epoxide hydrolase